MYESEPGRLIIRRSRRDGRESVGRGTAAERPQGIPVRELGIYTALGDMDRAFDALERALVSDPQRIALFLMWPEMTAVRADARFASVRRRLKLP